MNDQVIEYKEIKQGTLYGFDVVIKVPVSVDVTKFQESINEFTLGKHIDAERKQAVAMADSNRLLVDLSRQGFINRFLS